MPSVDPIKAAAIADFASSVYRSADESERGLAGGCSREEAVLQMAANTVTPSSPGGILAPALRARLDAMDKDYADILTRIDQMAIQADTKRSRRAPPSSQYN